MTSNQYFQPLSDDETVNSAGTDSVSTMSTYTSFSSTTCPNFDNTEWAIRQPDSLLTITRYVLKRTVLVYGIAPHVTKKKIFEVFSKFGDISDVIGVKDKHKILGRPDIEHAHRLTKKYIPAIKYPEVTTCFYIIFQTKGGFTKCAHKALHNPYFNIFKMDKRLKDFNLRRLS